MSTFLLSYQFMISIHALREEGDKAVGSCLISLREFLSTPSARRATLSFTGGGRGELTFLSTPSARRATAHPFCVM